MLFFSVSGDHGNHAFGIVLSVFMLYFVGNSWQTLRCLASAVLRTLQATPGDKYSAAVPLGDRHRGIRQAILAMLANRFCNSCSVH